MLVCFYIRFSTRLGQSLCMETGEEGKDVNRHDLSYVNEQCWKAELELEAGYFTYRYIVKEEGKPDIADYRNRRQIEVIKGKKGRMEVLDDWQDVQFGSDVFRSRAFSRVLNKKPASSKKEKDRVSFTHIIHIHAPLLPPDKAVCITGSSESLGNWSDKQFVKTQPADSNIWAARLNAFEPGNTEYKFAVYDTDTGLIVAYEDGSNRRFPATDDKVEITVLNQFAVFGNTAWRGAGVNVQLSSLRTSKSWGVGDFSDLKKLVGWSDSVGIKMIQLLPINDTTASHTNKDSYPYAAISAFALHPLFLDVSQLLKTAGIKSGTGVKKQIRKWNEMPALAYEEVLQLKMEVLREIFEKCGNNLLKSPEFIEFYKKHHYWLMPYAAFCYLRDKHGSADAAGWGTFGVYNEDEIRKLTSGESEAYSQIAFVYFLQFHLDRQLTDAVQFAHKKGIIIKGDLPIGVGRNSVDTWMNPHLFHMDMQAGAPPDAFTAIGQNWSFPTYNWEEMKKDGYAWWQQRLQQMSHYFDAIRIDHVLGFFRIWSVPTDALEGILGYFVPAYGLSQDDFSKAGLDFSAHRYCDPFLNDALIDSLFGQSAGMIREKAVSNGKLIPALHTQRGMIKWCEENRMDASILNKLLELSANLILLKDDAHPGLYHFRIGMQQTTSFRNLPEHEQRILEGMYHDYFFNLQNELWFHTAQAKLDAIQHASDMMICAEDLGMVPEMVEGVLRSREMLALQVQRMPKQADRMFSDPADAPYLSVVTPSTHDMSTIRQWWEEDRAVTKQFYHDQLKLSGAVPDSCNPDVSGEIIKRHLESPAMWAVFLLQDLLSVSESARRKEAGEERINNPANPDHFWNYRMHITIDDLQKQKDLNGLLAEWIRKSGR